MTTTSKFNKDQKLVVSITMILVRTFYLSVSIRQPIFDSHLKGLNIQYTDKLKSSITVW